MNETLGAFFQRSKGEPVKFGENLVYAIYEFEIREPHQEFQVHRLRAAHSPVPGLQIKVMGGNLDINGRRLKELVLWADTSPPLVKFCALSDSGCQLKIWNVWRMNGSIQAWVGNAGFLADEMPGKIKLQCSSGVGSAEFTDLVIEIERCS